MISPAGIRNSWDHAMTANISIRILANPKTSSTFRSALIRCEALPLIDGLCSGTSAERSPEGSIDVLVDRAHGTVHQRGMHQTGMMAPRCYCGKSDLCGARSFIPGCPVDIVSAAINMDVGRTLIRSENGSEATFVDWTIAPFGVPLVVVTVWANKDFRG